MENNNFEEFIDNNYDEEKNVEPEICPVCGAKLIILEPGNVFYCNVCKKYFANEDGKVGPEIEKPETEDGVLY